jgi:hypothetical protein
MSTDYRPLNDISYDYLFDGRLEKYDVREELRSDTTTECRYLFGRDGVLIAFRENDGNRSSFSRPSFGPMPWSVFDAIAAEFQSELVSEHDHRYWGFNTADEWDNFNDKLAKDGTDKFYNNVLHYVRGEPNDLLPGTIGMRQADIAKALIEGDRSLIEPQNRDALLQAVERVYLERDAVSVKLTDRDLAAVEMLMARTETLPRG